MTPWNRTQISSPLHKPSFYFFFFFHKILFLYWLHTFFLCGFVFGFFCRLKWVGGVGKGRCQNRSSDHLTPELNQFVVISVQSLMGRTTMLTLCNRVTASKSSHFFLLEGAGRQREVNQAEKSSHWRPPLRLVARSASWWAARDNSPSWRPAHLHFRLSSADPALCIPFIYRLLWRRSFQLSSAIRHCSFFQSIYRLLWQGLSFYSIYRGIVGSNIVPPFILGVIIVWSYFASLPILLRL